MRRLAALSAGLALLAFAGAANAASSEGAKKEESADRQMVAPNVVTPVVRDGKLVNYLFVTVRIDFTRQANATKLRDRAHFLRDAFLKASHKQNLADPADEMKLNQTAALAAFRMAARQVLGAANVASVHIDGVDSLRRR